MLQNKVVMITGASRGLGKALAIAFAGQGAKLAISARNEERLNKVKKELEARGAEVLAVAGDMADPSDVERFVATAEDVYGRIDVLINNAGVFGPSPSPYLLDYPEEDFLEVLRVNAFGPFLVTKRVLAGMLVRGEGSVINVTSEAGRVGFAGWGAYGISKFALEGLTQTWADELEDSGVRINAVDPGEMDTDMHAEAVPDCDYELANPADVTEVFLWLASDESAHVHGQRLEAQRFRREGGKEQ
jgi:NAD(P)-dependent dehydrogenase (short-subunit alcohol dehydrogenase family)